MRENLLSETSWKAFTVAEKDIRGAFATIELTDVRIFVYFP